MNGLKIIILLGLLLACASGAAAAERDYQVPWCQAHNGKAEFVLGDRTRVDCLTETHAIEVDFSKKWAEAIGQALHYAAMTKKKPGIVLIVNGQESMPHVLRLQSTIEAWDLPIRVWLVQR